MAHKKISDYSHTVDIQKHAMRIDFTECELHRKDTHDIICIAIN